MTYVYECKSCGKITEVQQSIKDNPLTKLDCCEKSDVSRIIQPAFFMISGAPRDLRGYTGRYPELIKKRGSEVTRPRWEEITGAPISKGSSRRKSG